MRTGIGLICLLRGLRTGGEAELAVDYVEAYFVSCTQPRPVVLSGGSVERVFNLLAQVAEVTINDKVNADDNSRISVDSDTSTSLEISGETVGESLNHGLSKILDRGGL